MNLLAQLQQCTVYDLGRPLEATTPVSPNHPGYRMALLRRHGDSVRADGGSGANELIALGCHTGTHIDALCHVSHNGMLHGGIDAEEAARGGRYNALGAETIPPMLCRGVLLDVPASLGMPTLPAAYPISASRLEETARAFDIEVGAGDVVLVRTGWPVDHYSDSTAFAGWTTGVPGVDASGADWLADRQVRLAGSDTLAFEWLAPGAGHSLLPAHLTLLVRHGIYILEVLDLEAIAAAGVREFVFVMSPLKLVGATGSPARPLALVP